MSGRIFFEDVIRENLDIGRPKQIHDLQPLSDQGHSRQFSNTRTRIKQYYKEGQALCTETTINNTRDFYIGKSLRNLLALRKIGFQANRRLLETERITHDSILAEKPSNNSIFPASFRSNVRQLCDSPIRWSRPSGTPC